MNRRTSIIAGVTLLAVGAIVGAWTTAKTQHFPFSYSHVSAEAAPADAPPDILSLQAGFKSIVKQVQPAVVSVTSKQAAQPRVTSQEQQAPDDIFRRFFGDNFPGFGGPGFEVPQGPRVGLGSGVITSADGYILTNSHVVEGADEITVTLQDRREFTAKVVGNDADSDIAVLKVDASGLPFAKLGDSDAVEVGDIVLAMGNPFGIGQTVTMGIVGAVGRSGMGIEDYEDFIQTDAAINPGNSGGALVNVDGEIIGINTAIISRGGGNQGVGFAIPVNMASNVMDQLIDNGKVTRGWLGVRIQELSPEIARAFKLSGQPRGALVADVDAGSPAEKGGLQRGDIILGVNGKKFADLRATRLAVADLAPGSTAHFDVFRKGKETDVAVVIGERPAGGGTVISRNGERPSQTPQLGISVEPPSPQVTRQFGLPANTSGLVITNVEAGSAASEAGLRAGDVILEVDNETVNSVSELQGLVRNAGDGSLLLLIQRDGGNSYIVVKPR